MARDLYLRDTDDPNYDPNLIDIDDELEMLISQIKMLLLTAPGEVMGDPNFGIDLEGKLFDTKVDGNKLKKDILNQMREHCPLALQYDINFNIKFFKGTTNDAVLIDIVIDGRKIFGVFVK